MVSNISSCFCSIKSDAGGVIAAGVVGVGTCELLGRATAWLAVLVSCRHTQRHTGAGNTQEMMCLEAHAYAGCSANVITMSITTTSGQQMGMCKSGTAGIWVLQDYGYLFGCWLLWRLLLLKAWSHPNMICSSWRLCSCGSTRSSSQRYAGSWPTTFFVNGSST